MRKKLITMPAKVYPEPLFERYLARHIVDELLSECDSETSFARRMGRAVFKQSRDYTTPIRDYDESQNEKLNFIEHCVHFFFRSTDRKEQKKLWSRCREGLNEQRWKTQKRLSDPTCTLAYDFAGHKIKIINKPE